MNQPPIPKFNIGDWCYLRQSVTRDRGHMSINGREVERILLQDKYLITEVIMHQTSNGDWEVYYQFNTALIDKPIRAREMECIDAVEASAILQITARNRP